MTRRPGTPWLTTALLAALTAPPGHAGVEVLEDAARSGTYGLRAHVVEACQGDETVLVSGQVETAETAEACREVVLEGTVAAGGRLTALAGDRVVLRDGFAVETGGSFVAGVTGAWAPSHVIDDTPTAATDLLVRWHGRFDAVSLAPGETVTVLRLRDAEVPRAWVRFEPAPNGGWLWAEVLEADGTRPTTDRAWITPGWHHLELRWDSGAAIAPTGRVELAVDGQPAGALEDLALGATLLEAVDLGALEADAPGGWLEADDYEVSRD